MSCAVGRGDGGKESKGSMLERLSPKLGRRLGVLVSVVDGHTLGTNVGELVGVLVGTSDGVSVGTIDGFSEGVCEGKRVGTVVGVGVNSDPSACRVGVPVGASVGVTVTMPSALLRRVSFVGMRVGHGVTPQDGRNVGLSVGSGVSWVGYLNNYGLNSYGLSSYGFNSYGLRTKVLW